MNHDENISLWAKAAEGIDWFSKPELTLDDSKATLYSWFSDGVCNTCFNSLDRHVTAGRGEQTAIIYDSPVTDTVEHWSYQVLLAA